MLGVVVPTPCGIWGAQPGPTPQCSRDRAAVPRWGSTGAQCCRGRAGMGPGHRPGGLGGHPEAPRPHPPHFTTCRAPAEPQVEAAGPNQEGDGERRSGGRGGATGPEEREDERVISNEVYKKQQLPSGRTGPPRNRAGGAVNSNQAQEVLNSCFPSVFGETPDATGLSRDGGETLCAPPTPG